MRILIRKVSLKSPYYRYLKEYYPKLRLLFPEIRSLSNIRLEFFQLVFGSIFLLLHLRQKMSIQFLLQAFCRLWFFQHNQFLQNKLSLFYCKVNPFCMGN